MAAADVDMTGGLSGAWRAPDHAHRVFHSFRVGLHLGNTGRVGEIAERLRQLLVTCVQRAIRGVCRQNLKLCGPLQIIARCKHCRPPTDESVPPALMRSHFSEIKADGSESRHCGNQIGSKTGHRA